MLLVYLQKINHFDLLRFMGTCNLNKKNILLIAPKFFGYDNEIAKFINALGHHVDLLPDRPFNTPLAKAFFRVTPKLGHYVTTDSFFSKSLESLGRKTYDIVFIIQGEGISINTLTMIRGAYPNARMIFYTWDSVKNKPYIKEFMNYFDNLFTFDPNDASQLGISFRPLFFSPGFDQIYNEPHQFDLSFVGTIHSDRYAIIKKITQQLPKNMSVFLHLYLQSPWMYDYRRLFTNSINGARRGEFEYHTLDKEAVQATFLRSHTIIDIEHPSQCGVTMRTFEALGSARKIITTNQFLRNYDFYNPQNILIINRNEPRIDISFLSSPYVAISKEVRAKYSLNAWVNQILSI